MECAVPIHVAWEVFSEFQFRFRVVVCNACKWSSSLRTECEGGVAQSVSRLGRFLSILLYVFRSFVGAVSIHGVCKVFFVILVF